MALADTYHLIKDHPILSDRPSLKYFKDDFESFVHDLEACCDGDQTSEQAHAIREVIRKRKDWIVSNRKVRLITSKVPETAAN